jgi:hypothetical protein
MDSVANLTILIKSGFVLRELFGEFFWIQKDVWHTLKHLMDKCSKPNSSYNSFAGRLSNAMFYRDEVMYCELRDRLREAGHLEPEIEIFMKNSTLLRKAGVLRMLRERSEIRKEVAAAVDEYVSTGLFMDGFFKELEKLYKLIESGFLDEIEGAKVFYTNPKTGEVRTKRVRLYFHLYIIFLNKLNQQTCMLLFLFSNSLHETHL